MPPPPDTSPEPVSLVGIERPEELEYLPEESLSRGLQAPMRASWTPMVALLVMLVAMCALGASLLRLNRAIAIVSIAFLAILALLVLARVLVGHVHRQMELVIDARGILRRSGQGLELLPWSSMDATCRAVLKSGSLVLRIDREALKARRITLSVAYHLQFQWLTSATSGHDLYWNVMPSGVRPAVLLRAIAMMHARHHPALQPRPAEAPPPTAPAALRLFSERLDLTAFAAGAAQYTMNPRPVVWLDIQRRLGPLAYIVLPLVWWKARPATVQKWDTEHTQVDSALLDDLEWQLLREVLPADVTLLGLALSERHLRTESLALSLRAAEPDGYPAERLVTLSDQLLGSSRLLSIAVELVSQTADDAVWISVRAPRDLVMPGLDFHACDVGDDRGLRQAHHALLQRQQAAGHGAPKLPDHAVVRDTLLRQRIAAGLLQVQAPASGDVS